MNGVIATEQPQWKVILNMLINPGEVVKKNMSSVPWYLSMSVSGSAFGMFFLQTGLDMYREGGIGVQKLWLIGFLGVLYGTVGVALIALMVWAFTKSEENNIDKGWVISSFALGYSATFVYAFLGLMFSVLFDWQTSVAFGVTGVLWAIRPTIVIIKQISGDRMEFSIMLSTLCGAIMLFGWSLLSNFA